MPIGKFLLAGTVAAIAIPASAAVTVIGNSSARTCYLAAKADAFSAGGLRECDTALGEEALSHYDTVATYVNRGILRMRGGNLDKAIADFDAAIATDPNQPEAYLNKGAALLRRDSGWDAAVHLFTAALEKRTQMPAVAYLGRGMAHEQAGNLKAAYRDYQQASAADPDWEQPALELARFTIKRR